MQQSLEDLQIHLRLPIALNDQHKQGLYRAVEACIIHNTLLHPPRITTDIQQSDTQQSNEA